MKEFKFIIDGHKYEVSVNEIEDNNAEVTVNGTPFNVLIEKKEKKETSPVRPVAAPSVAAQPRTANGKLTVSAPLPGSIVKILTTVGASVKKGDTLLTMESMKMENNIVAEADGTVKAIFVESGKNVMQDDKLIELETAGAPAQAEPQPVKPAATQPAPAPKQDTPKPAAPKGGFKVTSPLPGSVVKVLVTDGQQVKKGDTLLTLESMKMENSIMAETDGTVSNISVSAGQNVMQDDLLLVIA
ncbi:MAG: biotin/lipoyl-binding protein [Paludibacter sp.]|nr:biotin/lipoyl-binding protein [Bacteroidales bacterium]MCM1068836.1 biotin/lipoyl-binding protein [Prevotella sp.]MCM1353097.1 biotin/lipoyl-binding protein [Bacteroides sp.]MCM1442419.1 biotin/lipoyl-binding protein [Muribaculum sp.]MCM1481262.1 biotin/lipoyl-binding protein [Paludibacter sp.]